MITFELARSPARIVLMCLAALLLATACADDDKPAAGPIDAGSGGALDAASPVTTRDATLPGSSDAASPRPGDSGLDAGTDRTNDPSQTDASAGNRPDASPRDLGDSGSSDAAAPDASVATGARPLATSLMLPNSMEAPGAEPVFDVFRPTDMAAAVTATGRPLPVIVWANGGCVRSTMTWAPLFKRWAAAGFVVLALSVKPGGSILDALNVTNQMQHGQQIDWVLEQAKKQGSPYAGNIDTSSVVAAGNSCGGVTAMELASKDTRVKSVFVLSGSSAVGSSNTTVINGIKVPVGFVVGNAQADIAAPNALMDYQMLQAGLPAMIVNHSTGDHMTVSTEPMILPQVADIALNWLDLSLYGNKQAAAALKSPNVCATCSAGVWKLQSKGLETLEK